MWKQSHCHIYGLSLIDFWTAQPFRTESLLILVNCIFNRKMSGILAIRRNPEHSWHLCGYNKNEVCVMPFCSNLESHTGHWHDLSECDIVLHWAGTSATDYEYIISKELVWQQLHLFLTLNNFLWTFSIFWFGIPIALFIWTFIFLLFCFTLFSLDFYWCIATHFKFECLLFFSIQSLLCTKKFYPDQSIFDFIVVKGKFYNILSYILF